MKKKGVSVRSPFRSGEQTIREVQECIYTLGGGGSFASYAGVNLAYEVLESTINSIV